MYTPPPPRDIRHPLQDSHHASDRRRRPRASHARRPPAARPNLHVAKAERPRSQRPNGGGNNRWRHRLARPWGHARDEPVRHISPYNGIPPSRHLRAEHVVRTLPHRPTPEDGVCTSSSLARFSWTITSALFMWTRNRRARQLTDIGLPLRPSPSQALAVGQPPTPFGWRSEGRARENLSLHTGEARGCDDGYK
jgi:hypothetical protein